MTRFHVSFDLVLTEAVLTTDYVGKWIVDRLTGDMTREEDIEGMSVTTDAPGSIYAPISPLDPY